ncbi:hypothetical protein [Streptomyces globosus]|uniref:hypothetical protein n=1 Tax=Streptomyces globosus TaxID=68209 RepID=UPI0036284DBB
MPSTLLTHALTTPIDPPLRPLPDPVPDLLATLGAAPASPHTCAPSTTWRTS